MAKSKNGLTAVGLSVLGAFLVLLAFTTKSWLVTDGKLKHPKFERIDMQYLLPMFKRTPHPHVLSPSYKCVTYQMYAQQITFSSVTLKIGVNLPIMKPDGLWVVCFKDFEDPHHWYDTRFHSCWWVFEEEYYIINDILFKGFYIATQFFFSTCVLLTTFGLFYSRLYMYLNRAHEHYVQILLRAAILYLAAAICSTIALTIFGLYGDSRVWLPNWEHNDIGWSYGVAVAGTIALYVSGVLYGIEGRVHMYKRKKMDTQRDNYNYDADDAKQMSHTDV